MTDKEMLDEIVKLRSQNSALQEQNDRLSDDYTSRLHRGLIWFFVHVMSMIPVYFFLAEIVKALGAC